MNDETYSLDKLDTIFYCRVVCHLRDFEDKILLHQFLKSESTKGLSLYIYIYKYMVNSDKQERSRIIQIILHQFLKSESTNGLSIYPSIPVYVVNSDKQERLRIVQIHGDLQ